MPIFQAESRIFFDPFLLFEPGEVFREKHGVLLYFFFTFPFQRNNIKARQKWARPIPFRPAPTSWR
jgi:hypothetical protein